MQIGNLTSARLGAFQAGQRAIAVSSSKNPVPALSAEVGGVSQAVSTKGVSPASPAETARAKLDADYKKADAEGTRIVDDIANGGRFLDVSKLDDEELAAVAKSKGFTPSESLTARAELNGRLAATLAPFGDSSPQIAMAIKSIYPTLSPAVRDAMGWDQAMLSMGDRIIAADAEPSKSKQSESFFDKLLKASQVVGGIKYDINLIPKQGGSVNLTA